MRGMLRTLLAVAASLALVACRAADPPPPPAAPYLLILGVAQDAGVPQIACTCEHCVAAREDPSRRRHAASALLVDPRDGRRWLFDATPDLREQVELARGHGGPPADAEGRPPLFDGVFLTHAHIGHYAGLVHLGREAYASETTPLYATARMGAYLAENGPWSLLFDAGHLRHERLEPGVPIQLAPDLAVTPIEVPHRQEFSDTVAFRVDGPNGAALYLPDIDAWDAWDRDFVEELATVDVAFVDGTFFDGAELPGRDLSKIPHPLVVDTLARIAPLAETERRKVRFFHLNHSNPLHDPDDPANERIRRSGAGVAREGDRVRL